MSGARVPRGVVLTALLCALVVAAALGGAAWLRQRAAAGEDARESPPSAPSSPGATAGVRPDGCREGESCQVVGSATIGSTNLDLVVDPGGTSGRLRIGGPSISQVIEVTVTESDVVLGQDSLVCYASGISACLIRGTGAPGTVGQVVVGRSGKWSPVNRAFFSAAGYLALANVTSDAAPEVLAVQCADACPRVYVQVFNLGGVAQGCTRTYPRIEQLPGHPTITVEASALRDCP